MHYSVNPNSIVLFNSLNLLQLHVTMMKGINVIKVVLFILSLRFILRIGIRPLSYYSSIILSVNKNS